MTVPSLRWTTQDLDAMPDHGGWQRYEIVEGELYMTRAPHFRHQSVASQLNILLGSWSQQTGLGITIPTPGLVVSPYDAVIPDLIWISQGRLADGIDQAGHLTVAPELVVEILSPGQQNEYRDQQVKLKLYSRHGVQEYWIVSWQRQTLEIYRRQAAQLQMFGTLLSGDSLSSPSLPGFTTSVDQIFA